MLDRYMLGGGMPVQMAPGRMAGAMDPRMQPQMGARSIAQLMASRQALQQMRGGGGVGGPAPGGFSSAPSIAGLFGPVQLGQAQAAGLPYQRPSILPWPSPNMEGVWRQRYAEAGVEYDHPNSQAASEIAGLSGTSQSTLQAAADKLGITQMEAYKMLQAGTLGDALKASQSQSQDPDGTRFNIGDPEKK